VSLDFIADLNMVINMSANDGAFKMCIALMRALYPLCKKGNRHKYKTVLNLHILHISKFSLSLTGNSTRLTIYVLYRLAHLVCIEYVPNILDISHVFWPNIRVN
jgi:hypothetical protein